MSPREWERAPFSCICGFCGKVIPPDAPMLVLRFLGFRKVRCALAECASETAPTDLPKRVKKTVQPTGPLALPFAVKRS